MGLVVLLVFHKLLFYLMRADCVLTCVSVFWQMLLEIFKLSLGQFRFSLNCI